MCACWYVCVVCQLVSGCWGVCACVCACVRVDVEGKCLGCVFVCVCVSACEWVLGGVCACVCVCVCARVRVDVECKCLAVKVCLCLFCRILIRSYFCRVVCVCAVDSDGFADGGNGRRERTREHEQRCW